ncbi:hypothetical protein Y032_0197g1552 [Ancylostoma ceylanicum]|uniref:Uncharacterized protein n=1 Tax=Ancylostoma ceylanicum TaxID=53326 RepID=A0A016SNF7_9BILA|nr:hypothetical protein Y032_0197g1552 [Ancylostoma ceylanicum]
MRLRTSALHVRKFIIPRIHILLRVWQDPLSRSPGKPNNSRALKAARMEIFVLENSLNFGVFSGDELIRSGETT